MAMLKGRAQGGPRDGVLLDCPESWNGKIMQDQYTAYAGHYEFRLSQTDYMNMVWLWIPDEPTRTNAQQRTRQPFAGYQYR